MKISWIFIFFTLVCMKIQRKYVSLENTNHDELIVLYEISSGVIS